MTPRALLSAGSLLAVLALSSPAVATEPPAAGAAPEAAPYAAPGPDAKPRPPTYTLPFYLRPAVAPNVVRIDGVLVPQKAQTTTVGLLLAGGRLTRDFGLYGRVGYARNSPDVGPSGGGVTNPIAIALYTPVIAPFTRLALFGGVTAPIGQGGGNSPDAGTRAAMGAGIYARSAMDNALFAVNYMTPTAGAGVAYIKGGWTLQAEVTILQLFRVRGDQKDLDESRTNSTAGALVGIPILDPSLMAIAEVHYQRWLSTPRAVEANGSLRQQGSAGIGLRGNFLVGSGVWMRPAIGLFMPIDDPMKQNESRIFHVDLPVTF